MKTEIPGLQLGENWTSAVAALEGILGHLGQPLPRHALMGLTGHAWHMCLGTKGEVSALPSGPADLDWQAMVDRYARTGFRWERFGGELPGEGPWEEMREAAAAWAMGHLDAGRPLIGWDFHLHEHGIVYGYDQDRGGFLVHDVLTPELGPFVLWDVWPTAAIGKLELFAPVEPVEPDPLESIGGALQTALDCFAGTDGPEDGQPRGTAAIDAWAEAFDGDGEIDRAGNAYTLVVLQAARTDGAIFLEDVAESIPELANPLTVAAASIREQVKALSPLITLFPFPSGGHGNVNNAGLRRAAAMALRRAAKHERDAADGIRAALAILED
ncbi:MAG: hypothetical protein AB7J35_21030 [Dehalococcoidia bacterium]